MPFAHTLGFTALPGAFFAALTGMVLMYLALIEFGKGWFYRVASATVPTRRRYSRTRHLSRHAARFSTAQQPPPASR